MERSLSGFKRCPLFLLALLFCLIYALCNHFLFSVLSFSSTIRAIREFPQNTVENTEHSPEIVLPPYSSPYDTYLENFTDFDRILYIQRNYRRFGSLQDEEKRQQVIDQINKENNRLARHVVFQDMRETGLGNSLLAVASSYIVSRILNASYQVNWSMYHEAFDSPLVQFNTNVSYAMNDVNYSKWKFRWSGSKPSEKTLRTDPIEQLAPQPNLVITTYYDYTKHLLASRRYDEKLIEAGLVHSFDHQQIAYTLLQNSSSFTALERTYYTEYPLMSAVQLFFRPKAFLQTEIRNFIDRWKGHHLIGMQIRMGSGGADFRDSHRFLHLSSLSTFIALAEDYRTSRGYSTSEVKWFLSTDSTEVERTLASQYPGRVVTMHTYRRGHSSPEKANRAGFFRAVLDIAVLSQCEFMVLTNHSSFGMIARMVNPEPAFVIVPALGYS